MSHDDLRNAVMKGQATFYASMKSGNHSFTQRLLDFIHPAGNETGLDCLLGGHTWYLSDPKKFQFASTGKLFRIEAENGNVDVKQTVQQPKREFPEEPNWACFCSDCGAGSYFTDIPDDVFTFDYWCRTCSTLVSGDNIIEHGKTHLEQDNRWPIYGEASVHAPNNGSK